MSQTKPGTSLQVWRLNQPVIPVPRLPRGVESRVTQIIKNSGNELNKCFRINEITFLSGAQFALSACQSTRIKAFKEQKRHILRKRTETCKFPGEAGTVAATRLHRSVIAPRDGLLPGGNVR
jgi:hypothetical protein